MPRVFILLATILLIVWQGGCLTVRDGMLINRCGLWQFATGRQIIFATNTPAPQIIERTSPPIVIYRQGEPPTASAFGTTTSSTTGTTFYFGTASSIAITAPYSHGYPATSMVLGP
jgi:hypothetical protein